MGSVVVFIIITGVISVLPEYVNESKAENLSVQDVHVVSEEEMYLSIESVDVKDQLTEQYTKMTELTPYEEIFAPSKQKEGGVEERSKTADLLIRVLQEMMINANVRYIKTDGNELPVEKYKKAKELLKTATGRQEGLMLMIEASIDGCNEAKREVAWALLFGVYIRQDVNIARELFEELAGVGDPEGHTGVGMLYALSLETPNSRQKSLLHFTIGALGGSVWARMALGYRYWYGLSVKSDCEKALQYYRLAAKRVIEEFQTYDALTTHRLLLLDEQEDGNSQPSIIGSDVKAYYEMIAEKGDQSAQLGLGDIYYRGSRGLPRDLKKSLHYFQLAASSGSNVGNAFIGKILLEGGENVEVDLPLAYSYLKKSADQGSPIGEAGLGKMYLDGKFVPKDYSKALYYFNLSANKGWVEGMVELAMMYYRGIGSSRDFTLAIKYFMSASMHGHVLAIYYLGVMRADGIGVFRSCTTAVDLFKIVAERGRWGMLFNEGYFQYKERNYKEAFMIYAVLAEIGCLVGQSNAAFLLEEYPIDIPLNFYSEDDDWSRDRKALQYWSRSALQGYRRAYLKIGDCHYYGRGTDVDYETAFAFYTYSAQYHSNAQAMFNLGYMHEHGLGLEKDVHLAKRCYDLAMGASEDAWIPAGLALFKLNLVETLVSGFAVNWSQVFVLKVIDDNFGQYWDLILVTILSLICFKLLYMRFYRRDLIADIGNLQIFL